MLINTCVLPVAGMWGKWSDWSACTKSCKYGMQTRNRKCDSPAPANGGKGCVGDSKETRKCNEKVPCPGINRNIFKGRSSSLYIMFKSKFIKRFINRLIPMHFFSF